jgi:tetratricopeptide (TPR) repeat protein
MKNLTLFLLLFVSVSGYSQLNTNHAILTGQSRLYFGNYTGAIESFNMVIKMKPYLPEPYYYRGVAKLELNDFRGAKKDLDKAIEIKPFYPEALMNRGIANHNLKEYSLAMDDYSKAMELDGESADLYNNRGICKAALKDFKGAIEDYNLSIKLKSKNFNAYLNRSIAYQIQKEWDKAISDCNQLIRIKPNSPMGYMSRGLVKIEKEDYASALRDFDAAISYDPNNAFAYQNRGMVKQQLESYAAAIMDYDVALKIDPYMASAYFNRGIAKEMLGRDGYQKDYDNASLLDARFAKRPWQTSEERDKSQQQQLKAWQQQQKLSKNKNLSNIEPTIDSLNSSPNMNNQIDREELKKRKMKANLALEDNREIPGADENERGKIQDKNIDISLLPDFEISTINKKLAESEDVGYFNLVIENLNALNNYDPYLTITSKPGENDSTFEFYKNQILIFDERIRQNGEFPVNLLYRGIFETLLKQYNKAIDDLNKVIKLDERNLPAYFMRANARTKMIETIEKLKLKEQSPGFESKASLILPVDINSNSTTIDAYNDILTDYTVVLYMNPDFIFGYYNSGNIYCKTEKYFQSIEEFNKAISIEPEFAEAYYNRGLVKILMNDIEGGAKDLSKAGELGIKDAYNVLKRYCN